MKIFKTMVLGATALSGVANAQTSDATMAPMQAAAPTAAIVEAPKLVLPANTEIAVTPNDNLTTKGTKEGDTFLMSTVFDVMQNGLSSFPRVHPDRARSLGARARARLANLRKWTFSSIGSSLTGVVLRSPASIGKKAKAILAQRSVRSSWRVFSARS